jgi:predicted metalloendopeptidase
MAMPAIAVLVGVPIAAQDGDGRFTPGNLDRTCAPCKDFTQFATGGWMAQNPIPASQPGWGSFNALAERNRLVLRDILEQAAKEGGAAGAAGGAAGSAAPADPVMQKIGDFYASCMDQPRIEQEALTQVTPILAEVDAIPSIDALPAAIARLHDLGVGALFGFGSTPDAKQSSRVVAGTGQSGLGLPDRDYYLKTDAAAKTLQTQYVAHVARLFTLAGQPEAAAQASARTVYAVEAGLAKASMDNVTLRDPDATYHMLPIAELRTLTRAFSWDAYLAARKMPAITEVMVAQPDFFKALNAQLGAVPLADWKTYLRWHVLHEAAPYISTALDEENFAFYGRTLQGRQEQHPRWRRCVAAVDASLGEALGQKYVELKYPAKARARMNELIDNLMAALRDELATADWMSAATRKQAQVKLAAFKRKIGAPEHWRDYSALTIDRGSYLANTLRASTFEVRRDLGKINKPVDRTEWEMTSSEVNAYHQPLNVEIVFPAGILQPPFFDFEADDALNYGGIGGVIGHEIIHGFDDSGRKFDAQGNLSDWWTKGDAEKYEARAACVEKQFSSFKVADGLFVNGKLVLGESIADLAGLRLAYAAYQRSLKGRPRPAPIDGFTPEQRFFLGWAQVWANQTRPETERLLTQTNEHPLPRFRINGPLANLPEFAAAFQCKLGDPMVRAAAQRCRVW